MKFNTPPNPCFDTKTRTDCPRRCSGCAKTCEKWAEYVKTRDEVYDKRKESFNTEDIVFQQKREREKKRLEKQIRYSRIKRRQ